MRENATNKSCLTATDPVPVIKKYILVEANSNCVAMPDFIVHVGVCP